VTPSYLRKFIQPRRYQVATTSSSSSASDSRTFKNKYKTIICVRIRDVYHGSEFFHPGSRIQGQKDSGSRIPQRIKYFQPKKLFLSSRKYDPGCSSRIRIPDPSLDYLPTPDPGSRGQKGTRSRIRNTICFIVSLVPVPL
jgi:hypothetical protein